MCCFGGKCAFELYLRNSNYLTQFQSFFDAHFTRLTIKMLKLQHTLCSIDDTLGTLLSDIIGSKLYCLILGQMRVEETAEGWNTFGKQNQLQPVIKTAFIFFSFCN